MALFGLLIFCIWRPCFLRFQLGTFSSLTPSNRSWLRGPRVIVSPSEFNPNLNVLNEIWTHFVTGHTTIHSSLLYLLLLFPHSKYLFPHFCSIFNSSFFSCFIQNGSFPFHLFCHVMGVFIYSLLLCPIPSLLYFLYVIPLKKIQKNLSLSFYVFRFLPIKILFNLTRFIYFLLSSLL